MGINERSKGRGLRYSSRFIITAGIYGAFIISSELIPILKLSQIIIPLIILILLRGRELKIMVAFDLGLTFINILKALPMIEAFSALIIGLQYEQGVFYFMSVEEMTSAQIIFLFSSYVTNYLSAWVVMRKKHLRERATRIK